MMLYGFRDEIRLVVCANFRGHHGLANFFAPSAEVSMQIIVASTGGVIACYAVLGIMVVRHVQPLGREGLLTLQHPTQLMAELLVVWVWQKSSPPHIDLLK